MTAIAVRQSIVAPAEITRLAEALVTDAERIEFPDHSGFALWAEDGEDPYIDLSYMQLPDAASNNCHAATWAVIESLSPGDLPPQYVVEATELVYTSGVHWAVVVRDSETLEQWVVDFTARQFDQHGNGSHIPFPLVEPLPAWKATIDGWVAAEFGDGPATLLLHTESDL